MEPLWRKTAHLPQFAPLERDAKTEVLIVGGGITGILCAYFLERAGVDYLLLEAAELCGGITQNTTAKITSQHGLLYSRLIRTMGWETAKAYLEANQAALAQYRALCREIDCDFRDRDAFVYALDRRDKLEEEADVLRQLGIPAEVVLQTPLPVPAAGAVRFPGQAQFHPLKFAAAVARGLRLHERTKVLELRPGAAVTHHGVVQAEKIIIATHFPLLNKHGGYFLKLYQERSYVLALRGAPEIEGMYVDEDKRGMSFRSCGDLLLLGGGGHRTGKKGGGWAELRAFAKAAWPQAEEVGRWAAQDCMSLDGVPYIGRYCAATPNLFTATGYNKWGMTSSMAAALLLADLVQGKENPYEALFSPSRRALRPQLAANVLSAAAGILRPTVPRCPHMGCALRYNSQEHTWDCPCHGSRFAENGRLIDNPATGDLKGEPS